MAELSTVKKIMLLKESFEASVKAILGENYEFKVYNSKLKQPIFWSIHDFEAKATGIEQNLYNKQKVFDRDLFPKLLRILIHTHDANNGISWYNLRFLLEEYGKLPEYKDIDFIEPSNTNWKDFTKEDMGTKLTNDNLK